MAPSVVELCRPADLPYAAGRGTVAAVGERVDHPVTTSRFADACVITGAVLLSFWGEAPAQVPEVFATVETDPVPSAADAADDAAIWIHPADPALSLIIGTDKISGLGVYNLAGQGVQFLPDGMLNNVDLRYDFPLDGTFADIVCAGNRTDNTIAVYKIHPVTGELENITAGPISVGLNEAYGFCLYRSALSDEYYAFVNDKKGDVEQWRLLDNGQGLVDATLVRSFSVGSQTEGMVADDELGWLYIGEEDVGIWRYGAEPKAGEDRTLVDATDVSGHLTADVEGLTIYYASDGTGYLIASSQGSNEFVIYQRQPDNEYVMTFAVGEGKINGVTGTDGIDVINGLLGPAFPFGLFVAQDAFNLPDNQNFKLVPWDAIAQAGDTPLTIDTTWDPRGLRGDIDGDEAVKVSDLLLLLADWGPCPDPPRPCPADLDRDGNVGMGDLSILLASWG